MSEPSKRARRGLIVGVAAILGAFAYLIFGGISQNLVYFLTPGELLAKGPSVYEQPLRLGGLVAPGTVTWNAEALDLRFVMLDTASTSRVEVHARKAPPQMFREGMGVVVEGRMTHAGIFESTNLMVKHSEEYRAPPPGHDASATYKSLIREN